mgnify:CR=1 FL=1
MENMSNVCAQCGTSLRSDAKFCPTCGLKRDADSHSEIQLPSSSKKNIRPLSAQAKIIYTSIVILVLIAMVFVFFRYLPGGENPIISNQPEVSLPSPYEGQKLEPFHFSDIDISLQNGIISFDYYVLRDKKFINFLYHNTTTDIPVIAYISPSGKMVTAIGICEPCGSTQFSTDEIEIVSSCGTRFFMDNLSFSGGCGVCQKYPPDPIASVIDGNVVKIDESIVKNWRRRAE